MPGPTKSARPASESHGSRRTGTSRRGGRHRGPQGQDQVLAQIGVDPGPHTGRPTGGWFPQWRAGNSLRRPRRARPCRQYPSGGEVRRRHRPGSGQRRRECHPQEFGSWRTSHMPCTSSRPPIDPQRRVGLSTDGSDQRQGQWDLFSIGSRSRTRLGLLVSLLPLAVSAQRGPVPAGVDDKCLHDKLGSNARNPFVIAVLTCCPAPPAGRCPGRWSPTSGRAVRILRVRGRWSCRDRVTGCHWAEKIGSVTGQDRRLRAIPFSVVPCPS